MDETSLESAVGEQTVDNSGLSRQRAWSSLDRVMRRAGLGKGLGTLMEPAPTGGKVGEEPEGAVRLFLRTPERPTAEPTVIAPQRKRDPNPSERKTELTPGWIPVLLLGLDVLLVGAAGFLLSVGTHQMGKVMVLGSVLIAVAGALGVLGVWLWRRDEQ